MNCKANSGLVGHHFGKSICFVEKVQLINPITDPWDWYPDAPCREYLPTLGEKWPHSRGNVGKYSLHGAFEVYLPIFG